MAPQLVVEFNTVNDRCGVAIVYFLLYTFISVLVFAIIDAYGFFDPFIKFMSDYAYVSYHCRVAIAKKLDDRINGGTLEEGSNIALDSIRQEVFLEQIIIGKQILQEIKSVKPKRSGLFLQNVEEEQYKEQKSNFFASLLNKSYYGISPIMFREGACCCWFIKDRPVGFLEDLYYKFLNTNTIISMLTACHGHPFGREKKKIAFVIHSTLGLSFALLLSSINDSTTKIALNILVIAPTTLFINQFVYLNLSCPCIAPYKYGHYMSCCVNWIESFGRITVAPLLIASITLLILCAIFAITHDGGHFMSYYILQTQVVSFGGELIILYSEYLDGKTYYSINVLCLPVFSMGHWFNEYLKAYRYDIVNEGYFEEKEFGYIGYLSITKRYSTDKTFASMFAIDQLYLDRNKVFPINNSKDLVTNVVTDPNQLLQRPVVATNTPYSAVVYVAEEMSEATDNFGKQVTVAAVTAPDTSTAAVTTATTSIAAVTAANASTAAVTAATTSTAAVTAANASTAATQQSPSTVSYLANSLQQSIEVLTLASNNMATEVLQFDLGEEISTGWS